MGLEQWMRKDGLHRLMIDGRSSEEFGFQISGGGTYSSPEKNYEEIKIPGRSGALYYEDGSYKNIDVSYEAFLVNTQASPYEVSLMFQKLRSYLLSRSGYVRIEDSYHPDEYRLGVYHSAFEPEMHQRLQGGTFTLTFNCKPQRYLKKYEQSYEYASGEVLYNETDFASKPLIRAYGAGAFSIGGTSSQGGRTVRINRADGYTDIDCDIQEAYKDSLSSSCNNNIVLEQGEFPVLKPGDNQIILSGITRLLITPRFFVM